MVTARVTRSILAESIPGWYRTGMRHDAEAQYRAFGRNIWIQACARLRRFLAWAVELGPLRGRMHDRIERGNFCGNLRPPAEDRTAVDTA